LVIAWFIQFINAPQGTVAAVNEVDVFFCKSMHQKKLKSEQPCPWVVACDERLAPLLQYLHCFARGERRTCGTRD
jgi:hypothetical protein